jgi:hypothetical protein
MIWNTVALPDHRIQFFCQFGTSILFLLGSNHFAVAVHHKAEIHGNHSSAYMLCRMVPLLRVRLMLYLLIVCVTMFLGWMVFGVDEFGKGYKMAVPAFGVACLLAFWPGMQLFWNVHGEEYLEVSPKAIRWGYNYGVFKFHNAPKQFDSLEAHYRKVRTTEEIEYGVIDLFAKDEDGFPMHLHSTTIPIPQADALQFIQLLHEMLEVNFMISNGLPFVSLN